MTSEDLLRDDTHAGVAAEGNETLTRAEDLWFNDGSLIIRAENTLFRISGDNLAVHSSVFRDMLALPSPNNLEENMMDGCRFVRLPDTAMDIQCFLKALFDYRFFSPFPSPTSFPVLSAVLRMSHKYDVEDLRGRALGHLSEGHPTSLSDFLSPRNLKSSSWANPFGKYNIAIICLARQVSAEWMIPVTLYRLCQHIKETEILDGINVQGRTVRLDRRDQIFALKAVTFLRGDAISEMLEFLCTPFEISGCRNGATCSFSRLQMHAIADGWRRTDRGHHMPFTIWTSDDFDDFGKKVKIVCSVCLAAMKKAHMRALQELWDQLPGLCGLSGWTDLRQKKMEAVDPMKAKMRA